MIKVLVKFCFASFGFVGAALADEDPFAEVSEQLELCATCHGEGGAEPLDETIPILAGQHLYYVYVQLKDFKSGLRENDIMGPMAGELEKAQMLLIAEYYSLQAWPRMDYEFDGANAGLGRPAAGAGQCVQCHLGGWEGASRVPRLAGQSPVYLEKTMLDFKAKLRNNSPAKSSLLSSFADEQINGMAAMLGGM